MFIGPPPGGGRGLGRYGGLSVIVSILMRVRNYDRNPDKIEHLLSSRIKLFLSKLLIPKIEPTDFGCTLKISSMDRKPEIHEG